MLTFTEWRIKTYDGLGSGIGFDCPGMKEMAGVSTIVTKKDCNNPDYQVQGAVCDAPKTTPKKKKKKNK